MAGVEAWILAAEAELAEVETAMADPTSYTDGARARELVRRQRELKSRLEELWAELARLG